MQTFSAMSRLGVNSINILHALFSYTSALHNFSLMAVWLCYILEKNIGAKAAHKMVMKLTTDRKSLFMRSLFTV